MDVPVRSSPAVFRWVVSVGIESVCWKEDNYFLLIGIMNAAETENTEEEYNQSPSFSTVSKDYGADKAEMKGSEK